MDKAKIDEEINTNEDNEDANEEKEMDNEDDNTSMHAGLNNKTEASS